MILCAPIRSQLHEPRCTSDAQLVDLLEASTTAWRVMNGLSDERGIGVRRLLVSTDVFVGRVQDDGRARCRRSGGRRKDRLSARSGSGEHRDVEGERRKGGRELGVVRPRRPPETSERRTDCCGMISLVIDARFGRLAEGGVDMLL